MDQMERSEEINLMEYLEVLWKRKWLIILPTFLLMIIVGALSFLQKPVWEVDAIIQPGKFTVQTQTGQFEEVIVVDPKQVAGQINQRSYNNLLAAELNIDQRKFPEIKAEAIKDTKLVRTWVRDNDVKKATQIITALFAHLKSDYDKRIDVEIKSIDTQITGKENQIKENDIGIIEKENQIEYKKLLIKDRENEIKTRENEIKKRNNDIKSKELEAQSKELETKSRDIEKNRIQKEIESDKNKLKISEERVQSILKEMKSVKDRIDELDKQLQKALAEKKQGSDAIGLLLYSNEVQQNLRYYNTLDEKLSTEKITQENSQQAVRDKEEQLRQIDNQILQINTQIKQIDTQKESIKTEIDNIHTSIAVIKTEIEKINNEKITVKNDIEKIKNAIAMMKSDIQFLGNKKSRIDYTTFVKEPTPSLNPVAPKKKMNILIAGILGLTMFVLLAFFLEYLEKNKKNLAAT